MDDFKIWFYVIIGVVYVISRMLKKSGNKPADQPRDENRPVSGPPSWEDDAQEQPRQPNKQLTFEELLREITQGKVPEPEPQPQKTEYYDSRKVVDYSRKVVDYDDDLKEEEQDLETIDNDYTRKTRDNAIYEDAKALAFNRRSLEETMKVDDTIVKFAKFSVFEEDKKRNLLEEYTRDLQDPEGFRKAVVMSEILNRRF